MKQALGGEQKDPDANSAPPKEPTLPSVTEGSRVTEDVLRLGRRAAPKLFELEPAGGLVFDLQADKKVEQTLAITNVSDGPIAFKIKTNRPMAYTVQPVSKVLAAGRSVDVKIVLQPALNAPLVKPHQFLVQAVALDTCENLSKVRLQFWV